MQQIVCVLGGWLSKIMFAQRCQSLDVTKVLISRTFVSSKGS